MCLINTYVHGAKIGDLTLPVHIHTVWHVGLCNCKDNCNCK